MMTIVYILLALWILRSLYQVLIGLGEILIGLICTIFGLALIGVIRLFEAFQWICKLACNRK